MDLSNIESTADALVILSISYDECEDEDQHSILPHWRGAVNVEQCKHIAIRSIHSFSVSRMLSMNIEYHYRTNIHIDPRWGHHLSSVVDSRYSMEFYYFRRTRRQTKWGKAQHTNHKWTNSHRKLFGSNALTIQFQYFIFFFFFWFRLTISSSSDMRSTFAHAHIHSIHTHTQRPRQRQIHAR